MKQSKNAKERIEALKLIPLSDAIEMLLPTVGREHFDPATGASLESTVYLARNHYDKYTALSQSSRNVREAATMTERVALAQDNLRLVMDVFWRRVQEAMVDGKWFAFGWTEGSNFPIPTRAWAGEFDWHRATLSAPDRTYTKICILSNDTSIEDLDFVENHFERISAQAGTSPGPTKRGRPSARPKIAQAFDALADEIAGDATLASAAIRVKRYIEGKHPSTTPPSLATIETAIRDAFRKRKRTMKLDALCRSQTA